VVEYPMSEQKRLDRGRENFKKVYGDQLALPAQFDENGYIGYTLKSLFSDIYGRSGLGLRERRFVILGALAGLGADPALFEIHVRSAIANGELSVDELREVIMTTLPYVGYPRTSPLYVIVEKCVADFEQRAAQPTSQNPTLPR
jgi:4-carboxymuconolactone decarboxylase